MTLRRQFITFAALIHLVPAVLALFLLAQNKILFALVELLIVISIPVTVRLYKSFLKPLDLLAAGIDSIKGRDFSTTFVPTGHDELDRLVAIYNRMITQLREERVQQERQHVFMQKLIDATPIGVIILNFDGLITMVNPAAREILGTESGPLTDRTLESLAHAPASVCAALKPGETRTVDVSGMHIYKCRKSHFTDRGFFRQFVLIEELTPEILMTQKKAYDKVIRMMSHEINNTVGAVNSILQSSEHYAQQLAPEDRRDFEGALQVAIQRNSGLDRFMGNLANVVRTPPPAREMQDLHSIIHSVEVLMSGLCRSCNIRWALDLAGRPLMVSVDGGQMEQVLVNIVKNAVESIGENGTITVQTLVNESIRLRIIDDGKGIPEHVKPHLFTPFYSTKRDGQGVGLTLIREILINHGFRFNLETTDPGRTEFWIDFGDAGRLGATGL